MLRITPQTNANAAAGVCFVLEGRLVGPWVAELRKAARSVEGPLRLDLAGVHFVDAEGLALLRRLRKAGATLRNAAPFVQELLALGPAP
jgi:ABC-type transporter Mla MlaB component